VLADPVLAPAAAVVPDVVLAQAEPRRSTLSASAVRASGLAIPVGVAMVMVSLLLSASCWLFLSGVTAEVVGGRGPRGCE
jgi:hypothetical protein